MAQRTLSKSDFKLARTCDAKLFYRENGYPDNRERDPYMALLAEGGYMVEALAKARYPAGIQLEYGGSAATDFERTREALKQKNVTLFEATLLVGRRQARLDILEKKGDVVRLIEVKAKSFDSAEHELALSEAAGVFRLVKQPHGIRETWREKLEDLTYQVLLLEKVLPNVKIKPVLALVDTCKRAVIDRVPDLFKLEFRTTADGSRRLHSGRYIGTPEQVADLDLVTEVDVSEEVALLRDEVEAAAAIYESRLDAPLSEHQKTVALGSNCGKCEFRTVEAVNNGFNECWGQHAKTQPHMLELYSVGNAKGPDRTALITWMLKNGKSSLLDIPEEALVKADGSVGVNAERQLRQIAYTRQNKVYIGPSLRSNIEALKAPIAFIDFETSRLALPYHKTMRPYGLVTFQWSAHTTPELGRKPEHTEWLNNEELWPNQLFAESLRAAIGDTGPVLTWSHFEASILREIVRDLATFGRDVPELVEWMRDVFDNRIRDMHEWTKAGFFHPGMRGRTGIKFVLDALWKSDPAMREQFEEWTGLVADPAEDPYSALPPVLINGAWQDVHEGTGAMRAYQEMMYGELKNDPASKESWGRLLKQYCKLDTLSMVLIMEHWRRAVGLA